MLGSLWRRIRGLFPKRVPREQRELLAVCRGDAEQMWRLIDFEMDRRPGITHRAACRAALERLRRDRR